jgi:hypothetical protein
MFKSAMEDFNSLINIWVKSAKFFAQYFWQFVLIIVFISAISSLITYPIQSYLPQMDKLQTVQNIYPLLFGATLGLIINQMLMTILIVYVVLFRSKNILMEVKAIYNFVYGKFWKYLLALLIKVFLVALASMLSLIVGFAALTILAMTDYYILIEDRGIIDAMKESFHLVKGFFLPFFVFTLLFYGLPLLFLKGVFSIALLTLYNINTLMVYMKHYHK